MTRRTIHGFALLVCGACSSSGGASPAPGDDAGTMADGAIVQADAAADAGTDAGADGSMTTSDGGTYADPKMWLCGAGAPHDYCLDAQMVTSVHPDGTQSTSTLTPAPSPTLDCFYVYPSVDVTNPPGNEPDFSNLPSILDPVREQAAPFSQVCKVYAPLYHQATYRSYFDANAAQYLETAYADVAAAFAEYMAVFNQGRDFVLLGHSQGSHMLRRLVQREIETSPAVQKHLALAILLGALGDITVPKGQAVGGSFKSTPLCTADAQKGCVITFNTFAKGYEPSASYGTGIAAGMDVACNNPGALAAGGSARLAGSMFFTQFQNPNIDPPLNVSVSTPFAGYADYFTGACAPASNGLSFFLMQATPKAGDTRQNPVPFDSPYYGPALGLHLVDYAFPMAELIDAVRKRG